MIKKEEKAKQLIDENNVDNLKDKIQEQENIIKELRLINKRTVQDLNRDISKHRDIADLYMNRAQPLRNNLNKFFDQLEEQIHELKKNDLSLKDGVKKFIKELEWQIQMFRRAL